MMICCGRAWCVEVFDRHKYDFPVKVLYIDISVMEETGKLAQESWERVVAIEVSGSFGEKHQTLGK